jgi:pyruvate,orthophosphate dikinase
VLKAELARLKKELATPKALYLGALKKLLPMQRRDFVGIFKAMDGLPVTIRTLDPPLHEFLPHGEEELTKLARKLKVKPADLIARSIRRCTKSSRTARRS